MDGSLQSLQPSLTVAIVALLPFFAVLLGTAFAFRDPCEAFFVCVTVVGCFSSLTSAVIGIDASSDG